MPTEYRVKVCVEQKKEGVTVAKDGRLLVSVNAKREGGKANARCKIVLAQYLGVSPVAILIVRGGSMETKTVIVRG